MNTIDHEYIRDIVGIKLPSKRIGFHKRYLSWKLEVERMDIKDSFDAVEKVDKIKRIYVWVECYEFMEYHKHLIGKPNG